MLLYLYNYVIVYKVGSSSIKTPLHSLAHAVLIDRMGGGGCGIPSYGVRMVFLC
mgnify:CR=1 FL=1